MASRPHSGPLAIVRDALFLGPVPNKKALAALESLEEQLEAAGRLAEAAMYVGMWGESYHEQLAERLVEFEKRTGWSLMGSSPAKSPP